MERIQNELPADDDDAEVDASKTERTTSGQSPFGIKVLVDPYSDIGYDVIAVHGLYGDREGTWSSGALETATEKNWLKDNLFAQHPTARISLFGYESKTLIASSSARRGIRNEAMKLLNALASLRNSLDKEKRYPVVFIAQDVGGSIVKQALVLANLHYEEFGNISDSTRVLMFFGCPHRSSNIRDLESQLARLLVTKTFPPSAHLLWVSKDLAEAISETNGSFLDTKILFSAAVLNFYSTDSDPANFVFDKFTATMDIAHELRYGCTDAHKGVSTAPDNPGLFSKIDHVLTSRESPGHFDLNISTQMANYLHIIQSQAPPISPLRTTSGSARRFNWLEKNKTFQQWVKQPETHLLHVYGTTDVTPASQYIFQLFDNLRMEEKLDAVVMYFQFRKNDARFNSIGAMASTFISQLMRSDRWLPRCERNLDQLRLFRTWTDNDLFSFFEDVQNYLRLDQSLICVIDGMDLCDDSKRHFLSEISCHSGHLQLNTKIAILSSKSTKVQDSLSNHLSINLDEEAPLTQMLSEHQLDENPHLMHLLFKRPQFLDFEQQLRAVVLGCGLDLCLSRLTLEWLSFEESFSTPRIIERELGRLLPISPCKVFEGIMDSVPLQQQRWARDVLICVLHSFRPLTIWELEEALSLTKLPREAVLVSNTIRDFLRQIRGCFGPLFTVENNEICFTHPCALRFFLAPDDAQTKVWYAFSKQEINHREIADLCLRYLSLPKIAEKMISLSNQRKAQPRAPVFDNRYNFFSYAVRYWPKHFKLGYPSSYDAKLETTSKFVCNTQAVRTWNEVNWQLSNPISRTDRSFVSSLPIFVAHSLSSLVSSQIQEDEGSALCAIDLCLALTEAARTGDSNAIRLLLQSAQITFPALQDALTAAASSGDEAVLTELIQYSAKTPYFEWPPVLLPRAVSLGLDKIGDFLLKSGATVNLDTLAPVVLPLRLAVERNHMNAVKLLLDRKASVTIHGPRESTVLHAAASRGRLEIVKQLIEAGAELDAKDIEGPTPLELALVWGRHAIVQELLKAGADARSIEVGDAPAFIVSAKYGFAACVEVILQYRGELVPQSLKEIALTQATQAGHFGVCRLLLQHGADPNGSVDDRYILVRAVETRSLEAVKLLLEHGANVNLGVGSESGPVLSVAAGLGLKDITELLIQEGAGVNDVNAEGRTPLHSAAINGHHDVVRVLLDANADVNKSSAGERCPLDVAYNYPEVIRMLLDSGANIDRLSGTTTVFHLAAYYNEIDTIRLLISRHANLEIKVEAKSFVDDGFTPLIMASWQGHAPISRLLLDAGANINATATFGSTSLHYAFGESNYDAVRTLMDYNPALDVRNAGGSTTLHFVSEFTPISIVKLMLDRGANLEIADNLGYTPLCTAVIVKNVAVAKYLISRKAKINGIDGQKGGPLHLACEAANLELVKHLVEGGADVNVTRTYYEGTPLQCACWWQGNNDDEEPKQIIRYLVEEAKCDINRTGGTCGCALSTACLRSPPDTIEYLLDHDAQLTIRDGMGRLPVHYASLRTLDHLTRLLPDRTVPSTEDKLGSTPLHYAVTSGQVDVVQYVLSHSGVSVNAPYLDGWTPLFWALRPVGSCRVESYSQAAEIVRLLVDLGADLWARGKGWDREWSPLKVARYYDASEEVLRMLTPKVMRRVIRGVEEKWDSKFHLSRKARKGSDGNCDGCLVSLLGQFFVCSVCTNGFCLCFKCYRSSNTLHPDHSFDEQRPEYEGEEEGASGSVCEEEIEENNQDDEEDDGDWSEEESSAVGEQEPAGESESPAE